MASRILISFSIYSDLQIEMVCAMQAKSRRLCQDQIAWFREDPLFRWVDATQPTAALVKELAELIKAEFHKGIMPHLCDLASHCGFMDIMKGG